MTKENEVLSISVSDEKKEAVKKAKTIIKEMSLFTKEHNKVFKEQQRFYSRCFMIAATTPPEDEKRKPYWDLYKSQGNLRDAAWMHLSAITTRESKDKEFLFTKDPYPHLNSREFLLVYAMMKGKSYENIETTTLSSLNKKALLAAFEFFISGEDQRQELFSSILSKNESIKEKNLEVKNRKEKKL